jgi:hypothetical protein
MKELGRRAAVASVAGLSACGLMLGFGPSASAAAWETVQSNHLSIYAGTSISTGKVAPDLQVNDRVVVLCWGRGQNVRAGNVWYQVDYEQYNSLGGIIETFTGWVYGADTDSNDAFHRGDFPAC